MDTSTKEVDRDLREINLSIRVHPMTVAVAAPANDDDRDRKASLMGEFRRIVAAKQGTWIDGIPVDRFSAAQVRGDARPSQP